MFTAGLVRKVVPVALLGIFLVTIIFTSLSGISAPAVLKLKPSSNETSYPSSAIVTSSSLSESKQSLNQTNSLTTKTLSQTCLSNVSISPPISPSTKIAVVKPVFTATPYSQYDYGSFYAFYHKYFKAHGNITSNLGWLNTSVASGMGYNFGWGLSFHLFKFLSSPSAERCGFRIGRNVAILSDINVTDGALFYQNGSRRFDSVIVGFSEYVTLQEYLGYKHFVATGGSLVLLDSDAFEVQVNYSSRSNYETFVRGHGYVFDGKSAWHAGGPWDQNDTNWMGSTLCCFHQFTYNGAKTNLESLIGRILFGVFQGNVFGSYRSHEENGVTNMTDTTIIATFVNRSGILVAAYVHNYKLGSVTCFCVFGDDIIYQDQSAQYFLVQSVASFKGPAVSYLSPENSSTRSQPLEVATSMGFFMLISSGLAYSYFMRRRLRLRLNAMLF